MRGIGHEYRVSTLALSVVTFGAIGYFKLLLPLVLESDYFFAKDPSVGKDEKRANPSDKKDKSASRRQKTQKLVGQLQRKIKTLKTRK